MLRHVSEAKIKKVAELYNSGFTNPSSISTIVGINISSVNRALGYAKEDGLCDYKPHRKGRSHLRDSVFKR